MADQSNNNNDNNRITVDSEDEGEISERDQSWKRRIPPPSPSLTASDEAKALVESLFSTSLSAENLDLDGEKGAASAGAQPSSVPKRRTRKRASRFGPEAVSAVPGAQMGTSPPGAAVGTSSGTTVGVFPLAGAPVGTAVFAGTSSVGASPSFAGTSSVGASPSFPGTAMAGASPVTGTFLGAS